MDLENYKRGKCQRATGGLAQAGVYRRRKCSGNMNVSSPHELYRTPRLRQAAGTLYASGGDSAADSNDEFERESFTETDKPRQSSRQKPKTNKPLN